MSSGINQNSVAGKDLQRTVKVWGGKVDTNIFCLYPQQLYHFAQIISGFIQQGKEATWKLLHGSADHLNLFHSPWCHQEPELFSMAGDVSVPSGSRKASSEGLLPWAFLSLLLPPGWITAVFQPSSENSTESRRGRWQGVTLCDSSVFWHLHQDVSKITQLWKWEEGNRFFPGWTRIPDAGWLKHWLTPCEVMH